MPLVLLLFQLSILIVLMSMSDSKLNKIFFIKLTSTNLSHTKWIISFRFESFTLVSRWPTASLSFSIVIWGGVTGLGRELEVDAVGGVKSNDLVRLAFRVTTSLFFSSSFSSIIAPIGEPNFFSSSFVIPVIARRVSMFSSINFLRRSFCSLEKDIPSISASVIIQTLTVGKTFREIQKFKYAPRSLALLKETEYKKKHYMNKLNLQCEVWK